MKEIVTALTTTAIFSDEGAKRYLLKKVWDAEKPKLAIVMLAPSTAAAIELDTTTQLVLNNAARLGYGSVSIVNLFATLNDFLLKHAETEDVENMDAIVKAAEEADLVIYAPGVGKSKNKVFQKQQEQVLRALQPFEEKLHCLCSVNGGGRLQHPLSPVVRVWGLSPLKVQDLLPEPAVVQVEQKKRGRVKVTKVEQPS